MVPFNHHCNSYRYRPGVIGLVVLLFLFVAACSTSNETHKPPSVTGETGKPYTIRGVRYTPQANPYYDKVGTASLYGRQFHGHPTASGEPYDMNAMTAAHTSLPLGSRVRATNLANGRSVILTINDRGPFSHNRIIDVSRRAADRLGFRREGTAEVRVQVISDAQPDNATRLAQARIDLSDVKHFLPVLNRAMEHGTRLSEFFWNNPEQGRRGSIMPLTQPRETSRPFCRNFRRTAERGSEEIVYIGRACRNKSGSWRIVRERKNG